MTAEEIFDKIVTIDGIPSNLSLGDDYYKDVSIFIPGNGKGEGVSIEISINPSQIEMNMLEKAISAGDEVTVETLNVSLFIENNQWISVSNLNEEGDLTEKDDENIVRAISYLKN